MKIKNKEKLCERDIPILLFGNLRIAKKNLEGNKGIINMTKGRYKMRRVYCKNCKYFYCGVSLDCFAPNNTNLVSNFYNIHVKFWSFPERINKTNNCKYYKRKWWKVWI